MSKHITEISVNLCKCKKTGFRSKLKEQTQYFMTKANTNTRRLFSLKLNKTHFLTCCVWVKVAAAVQTLPFCEDPTE